MARMDGRNSGFEKEPESIHVEVEVPGDELAEEPAVPADDVVEATGDVTETAEVADAADAVEIPADEELSEQDMVDAAIRAGEEAAMADIKAEANGGWTERDDLAARLDAAEQRAADAADRFARLQADWENFRKRTAAERLAERERAAEKLVGNLLPVIDDLERAVEHAAESAEGNEVAEQLASGVDAVRAKLVDVLSKEGVETIDPAGEAFDPLEHQAVGRVEDADDLEDTVRDVYQRGYRMGGKVIRPAMVTVTYGGPKREAPEASAEDAAEAASANAFSEGANRDDEAQASDAE